MGCENGSRFAGMVRLNVAFCCVAAALASAATSSGVRMNPPSVEFFHALTEEPALPSILSEDGPAPLECKTKLFEDREVVDFEKREIYFERVDKAFDIVVWQYRYDELDSYMESRRHFVLLNAWYKSALSLLTAPPEKKKNPFTALQWELPVQYPAWAQRILGKDPPKLSISGFEKITVSYDYNKTDIPGSAVLTQPSNAVVFDQSNQFSITGSVGRLIGINITGSTNQASSVDVQNNPLKNFKIEYKGEGDELEDEIIQEVTAGFTGFDMPSTQLSGYSESHEGLFGVKVVSKIGPLMLTGIASTEQGESQNTTLHPSGQGDAGTVITEKQFIRNKMFFLDTAYRRSYINRATGVPDTLPKVSVLQVWLHNDRTAGDAQLSNTSKQTDDVYRQIGTSKTFYKLLKENRDYKLFQDDGYIRFDSVFVDDNDVVAVYLKTADSTKVPTKGANFYDSTAKHQPGDDLWVLKPKDQDSLQTTTFPLMWRNVYAMPSGFDPQKFRLRVVLATDTSKNLTPGGRFFSEVLGLTNDKGDPLATNTQIYDVDHSLIILPVRFKTSSTGGSGMEPFANDTLGEGNTDRNMYRYTSTDWNNIVALYQLIMSGSSRKTTFTLGFGSVMSGTEALYMGGKGGTKLDRNVDYTIDYQMGQLDLLSKRAQMADQIYVEFQSEALFVPQTKVFLGARGQIDLPIGEKSFMGMSVLWQNASSRERVPKINQEPFSKLLLDYNTQINLEPEWMTKAVNMLPLVSTDAKSSVNLEVEVAQSFSNPNTDGAAYIDDFEGSKETYPMGLSQGSWSQCSPPFAWQASAGDSRDTFLLHHPPAWKQYWYEPLGDSQASKSDIFDTNTAANNQTQADKYEPTLRFVCQPAPGDSSPFTKTFGTRYDDPWGGFMAYFPSGTSDREKDKYFEFWAKNDGGGGRLYVDMGEISEAVSVDGGPPGANLLTEDPNNTGNLANDSLDKGLDGRRDESEFYCVPNAPRTDWDTLWYWKRNDALTAAVGSNQWDSLGGKRWVDSLLPVPGDPSMDNYRQYSATDVSLKNNYPYVDGTEKNGALNTEDLNSDGFRTTENFYRRFIDFDSGGNTQFLARNAGNYRMNDTAVNAKIHGTTVHDSLRWHLYRIPLNDTIKGIFEKHGSPRWNQIKYVRIWWGNFKGAKKTRKNTLEFARMQFVGNQWLETPSVNADSTSSVNLQVSTVNTEDNARTYVTPPGIYRATDEKNNLAKEGSLDLLYRNIKPGTTALVRRSLSYQPLNLSAYSDLSLMVHGDTTRAGFWFFFRFGADDSTYYEVRSPVEEGWKTLDVRLKEISDLKLLYRINNGDTGAINTSVQSGKEILSIRAPRGRTPSFANVTWMALGVARDSIGLQSSWQGELWVDEMKVNGIRQQNGWAGRVYLSTKWADFLNLSVGLDYADGNFRRMTDVTTGLGSSILSANFSVDGKVSKFMPDPWNVSIPLGMRLQESLTRPEIVPSSDIYLLHKDGNADGFLDMYKDAINMFLSNRVLEPDTTPARHYQTMSSQRDWWTGFEKKGQSKNPFVNLLLERTSLDFSASHKTTETARGQLTPGGEDRLDKDTLDSYHGTFKYNLTPTLEPKYYKFKPFEKSKILWLPDQIKNYEFSYLPTTLTFDVAEFTYSKETMIKADVPGTTQLRKLELDHRMNLVFDPINILDFSYNLSIGRKLDNQISNANINGIADAASFFSRYVAKRDSVWRDYYILYDEISRTQGTSLRFDPTFLDWLSHKFEYSANYRQNANQRSGDSTRYQNIGMDRTFHLSSTLTLGSLFKKLADGFSSFKAMASVFNSISAGITKINFNSVTFDYTAKTSVRNDNMSTDLLAAKGIGLTGFYKYQFGLSGANAWDVVTGNMDDNALGGMRFRHTALNLEQNDQRTSDMNFSLSTNFNLPEPVDVQFTGISLAWSRSYLVRPDTTSRDTTFTWPDFSESARSGILNKISFVSQYMQGVSLTHKYSFQKKLHATSTSSTNGTTVTVSHALSPVVGMDGTLKKWPVSLSYAWDYSYKIDSSTSASADNVTHTTDNGHRASIKYELSNAAGAKQFKFLWWTVPIVGRLVSGAEFEYKTSKLESVSGASDNTALTSSWSLTPHLTYDFTDNITGDVKYTGSQKKAPNSTTTSHIFALSVEIRFNP
jgi:hypothetical protein